MPAHARPRTYASAFRAGLFAGRVAIVTGGGSGIGRCTAHELASLGARVALIGRRREKLAAVQSEIEAAGGGAACFTCDIRDEEGVRAAVAQVLQQFGAIDHLVNNAGGQFWAPVAKISAKGWDAVVRNNLSGGFLMARECYTQWMAKAGGGSIVNVTADFWNGMPGMAHSGAARAGMVNFTESAAFEWAAQDIRVNAVAPGFIASSGLDSYPPQEADRVRRLKDSVPLGRFGTESEVSAAITFLLSDAAAFITGTTLRIDGGAPNVRPYMRLEPRSQGSPAFDGFHLATTPKVLES